MSTTLGRDDRFLQEVVASSPSGVFAVDHAGEIVYTNGFLESYLGFESDRLRDRGIEDICTDERIVDTLREAANSGKTVEVVCGDVDGNRVRLVATCEEMEFDGSAYLTVYCQQKRLGGDHGTARQSDERLPVEEFVSVAGELFRAEDRTDVSEAGLAAVTRFLGTDIGCIRLLDPETNDFERTATTPGAADLLESRPAFDLNRSLAGRALRRNEPVVDRPRESEADSAIDRTNLHVPLGEQGTLTVFDSGRPLTNREIEFAEDLATLIADSLSRVGDSHSRRTDRLPVHDIVTGAVGARTPGQIGTHVCQRLVETGYDSAWFVTTELKGGWRDVEASAGETDSPPADLEDADSNDWVSRAVETDEVCILQNQRTVVNGRNDTNDRLETTAFVPVSYADQTYGVLVLHAGLDSLPHGQSELELLGDVAGLAVFAAENKKLLLSEKVQQLEFEVTDPNCLAVTVSEATDGFCEIEHQTLTNDGNYLCFMDIEGVSPEQAVEATVDATGVTECTVVDSRGEGCLLEVIKTRSGAEAMMDVGATVRHATAEKGVGTLVVEAPISADVREVVDAYTDLNPESTLVAKREVNRPTATNSLTEGVEDRLTEKQRSALTTAYYSGYFEWPRSKTAEEIADSMGISPATFHQHLRTAERNLLALVCEDPADSRE